MVTSLLQFPFKAFHGPTPDFISGLLAPYQPASVWGHQTGTFCEFPSKEGSKAQSFYCLYRLQLWDNLPDEVKLTNSASYFKLLTKGHISRGFLNVPYIFTFTCFICIVLLLKMCFLYLFNLSACLFFALGYCFERC